MKPKTKLQVEVWKLHQSISSPTEHEAYVSDKHDFYYTTHYKNLVCLECNHNWKPELEFWKEDIAGVECLLCEKKLKKIEIYNGNMTKIISYCIVQVVDRFQVIRYFSCWKNMYKNKKPRYHFRSLFEEWTDYEKNKQVVMGKNTTWCGDGFSSSEYEIRYNKSKWGGYTDYDRFVSDFNIPGAEFLPRFHKYGLKNDFHNCDYRMLLRKLEQSPKVETLLKARHKQLLFHAVHKGENYNEFWPQIKISLRNKYKISDPGMWYDYLQLLKEFKKDILNPKFILPKNLKVAHNEYVAKKERKIRIKNAEIELRRQENERLKCETEEILKEIKSEAFKNFSFKQGEIHIVALLEEEDVKKEGKILKHCVYANGYHKKAGILLMSARIGGKRIETIEISLASYTVIQSRGFDNDPTPHHDQILEVVRKNMGKISKIVEKHKKLKEADSRLKKLENAEAA